MPQKFKLDGLKLGIWVSNQRAAKDRLPCDLKQRLDDIEFSWDVFNEKWEEGFVKLSKYKEANGHCSVPARLNLDGFPLGKWVSHQRNKRDSMPREYIAKLSAVGFVWDVLDAYWQARYCELLSFEKNFGHSNVPDHSGSANAQLGSWCSSQRTSYKNGTLSKERINKLNLIQNWNWSQMDAYWERGYSNLMQYIGKEGHSSVPQKYVSELDGFKLGSWVSDRRRSCTEEQRKVLDATAGWVWNVTEEQFERGLREFVDYVADYGDGRVPSTYVTKTGFKLGSWVSEKRKRKKKNKVPEEQALRLSGIDQWVWDPLQQMFDSGFSKLLIYKNREGDCFVPRKHQEDGFNLGYWVSNLRKKKNRISSENKQRLDDIGFIWDASKGKS